MVELLVFLQFRQSAAGIFYNSFFLQLLIALAKCVGYAPLIISLNIL